MAGWLAAQDFSGCTLAHWQIEPQPDGGGTGAGCAGGTVAANACGRCPFSAGRVWR